MRADPCRRLTELAERERRALLEGRLELLPELAREKEAAAAEIGAAAEVPPERLRRLGIRLEANRRLLESALNGLRAVSRRLDEMRRLEAGLTLYDRAGRCEVHATARPATLEKRT